MPNTVIGPVNSAQLVGGAQSAVALTPQASDPAANAGTAQVYAKTDKNLYHEDTAGLITNLLLPAQVANSALGPQTISVGPFSVNNSSNQVISYGFNPTTAAGTGYVVQYRCSLIGISAFSGTQAGAASGSLTLLKNLTAIGTILNTSSTGSPAAGYNYATFNNGVYTFVPGDLITLTYSGGATSVAATLTLSAGNQTINALSTPLTANTTIASTDNQRVFLANASTQYTLTLPATQAASDFYVRVIVTNAAGVVLAAQSGQQIFLGTAASVSGGNISCAAVGGSIVLMNPAGTNLWIATDICGNWSVT